MRKITDKLSSVLFLIGLLLFFVSKRYFSGLIYEEMAIYISLAFVAMGVLFNFLRIKTSKLGGYLAEASCWKFSFIWQALFVSSLISYLIFETLLGENQQVEVFSQKILFVFWLLTAVLGVFTYIGVEISYRGLGKGHYAEPRRVEKSFKSWLSIGMLASILIAFNYAGSKRDQVFDWSYLKTTTASESTKMLLKSIDEPIKITAFFPKSNEVLAYVEEYFKNINLRNYKVEFQILDKDLYPLEAEEMLVSRNGLVVLSRGAVKEKINIGLKIRVARKPLSQLDQKFQKALLKISNDEKIVYFTRGHGELSWQKKTKNPIEKLSALESWFRNQNYKIKVLDVSSGLGQKIPDDATLLMITGPKKPFSKQEAETVKDFISNNGKVFFFFDVDNQSNEIVGDESYPLKEYLESLGIKNHNKVLANEQSFLRGTKTKADHWFLFSNLFASHASVKSLGRNDEKVALFFIRTGYFDLDKRNKDWNVVETVRSLSSSFVDIDMNYIFSKNKEKKKSYSLGFAAESKVNKSRILGLADASVLSDGVLRNTGNFLYLVNGIRWLTGSEKSAVVANSEEDVKIKHSKKEDTFIFYGSVFFFPLLILLLGAIVNRKRTRIRES